MLVPSMSDNEIRAEVFRDLEKLHQSTIQRLNTEYEKERRKLKIAKERTYLRHYPIKTAAKNNWIIYIGKRHRQKSIIPQMILFTIASYTITARMV
jgi:hypothetical protein